MSKLVYLAEPVDGASERYGDHLAHVLANHYGWVLYRPSRAFNVGETKSSRLYDVNMTVLEKADAVVALLPDGVQTIGTVEEITLARAWKVPTVVITDNDRSWQIHGWAEVGLVRPGRGVFCDIKTRDVIGEFFAKEWQKRAEEPATSGGEQEPMRYTGTAPTRAYPDDAGFDLYVADDTWIDPGTFQDIGCNTSVQLPEWTWGLLTGRSSTLRKKGLLVAQGVIDVGYRGELFAGVWNLRSMPVKVNKGDRIAQLIVLPNTTRVVNPVKVDELDPHPRGENGFGSSGV